MRKKIPSLITILLFILALFTAFDMNFELAPTARGVTIYVPNDYPTIQEAVYAAGPGNTVYVYSGTYYENVVVNYDIDLVGENRDTTIIESSVTPGIDVKANWVSISGFTIRASGFNLGAGIYLDSCGGNTISTNIVMNFKYGLALDSSYWNTITGNTIFNNGFGIHLYSSSENSITGNNISNTSNGVWIEGSSQNNVISSNNISSNTYYGIYLGSSSGNDITGNDISDNECGIYPASPGNTIADNNIFSNDYYGMYLDCSGNTITGNNIFSNTNNGVQFYYSNDIILINCSISNSGSYDFYFEFSSHVTTINTTFDKTKVYFSDTISTLTVKWYLGVNVMDYLYNPVLNAKVKIEDNKNGSYSETFTTDINGQIKWLPITEYIERDTNGDTIGKKTYYTPHRIIAWNDTLVGYAYPDPLINESKTVNIVLGNGTLLDLEHGWNLISSPRTQSDTNLQTVLRSVEGRSDASQWYNNSDSHDHWKHYHVSKPSFMNDLQKLDHKIGFWLHITDRQGTTLVVLGNEPKISQSISLLPGWNLVGYPSLTSYNRTEGLNNLTFGSEVNSIWTYDAATQKWMELGPLDYFEIGRGYWIHAENKCTWEVPL